MERGLERHGMRLDEFNRIRAIDEETDSHANSLKDYCKTFLRDTTEFQGRVDWQLAIWDMLGKKRLSQLRQLKQRESGVWVILCVPWLCFAFFYPVMYMYIERWFFLKYWILK